MNLNTVKVVGTAAGKLATSLMESGAFSMLSQYANQKMRTNNNDVIGNIERGVEHQARKMNLMKDDN